MYLPKHFEGSSAQAAQLMRQHPFASLISTDDDGLPFVTHLPLHLLADGDNVSQWKLLGHVAKPNPHWRYLQARPKATVSFLGPHAYMSPQVYPDLARVPTWNYVAVNATVSVTLLEGHEAKDAVLKHIIGEHEPRYAQQWIDLGEDYQHKMLQGITAFELRIESLQCKIKLNQHRKEATSAMLSVYESGTATERALAQWVRDASKN